jgi:hypothetical protein
MRKRKRMKTFRQQKTKGLNARLRLDRIPLCAVAANVSHTRKLVRSKQSTSIGLREHIHIHTHTHIHTYTPQRGGEGVEDTLEHAGAYRAVRNAEKMKRATDGMRERSEKKANA